MSRHENLVQPVDVLVIGAGVSGNPHDNAKAESFLKTLIVAARPVLTTVLVEPLTGRGPGMSH